MQLVRAPPEAVLFRLIFRWQRPAPPVEAQAQVAQVQLPGASRNSLRENGAGMAQEPATGLLGEGAGVVGLTAKMFLFYAGATVPAILLH